MCPRVFLRLGGSTFVALALLGSIGILGPTAEHSILGEWWFLDRAENVLHLIVGAILLSFINGKWTSKRVAVLIFGWTSLLFAAYLLIAQSGFAVHFERPISVLFYFLMSLGALMDGFCKDELEVQADARDDTWKL